MKNPTLLSTFLTMNNTATQDFMKTEDNTKYLNDLNTEELSKVADTLPKWVFAYRPYFMMYNYPEWVATFEPKWMAQHDTKYMLMNRMEWMIFNEQDTVARHNIDALIDRNPNWCVKNIPELLAYKAPSLLKNYDQSVLKMYRPEEHVEVKKTHVVFNYIKKLFKHFTNKHNGIVHFGTSKSHCMLDIELPKEVTDLLK